MNDSSWSDGVPFTGARTGKVVPVVFLFLLGGALGAVITYFVVRERMKTAAPADQGLLRQRMAQAWQEGFDAARQSTATTHDRVPESQHGSSEPVEGSTQRPMAPVTPTAPTAAPPWNPSTPPPAVAIPARPEEQPVGRVIQWQPAPEDPGAGVRRQRRNINITLYVAALLIVAAAALFLTSSLPYAARMVGILALTGLFYLGGLTLHRISFVLRPAALAFTGTGLALIPLIGVAMNELGLHHPELSWLVTSVLGLILMVVAAERLHARVAVYLTMPFVISASLSVGALLQRGMVWGLLFTIAVSVVMTWLGRGPGSDASSPGRWDRYRLALHQTHRLLVPAIIVATLVLGFSLGAGQVLALLLAAAAYYANAAIVSTGVPRLWQTYGMRALVTVAFIPAGIVLNWSWSATTALLGVILLAQAVLVFLARRWHQVPERRFTPLGAGALRDAGACFGGAVFVAAAARGGALWDSGTWMIHGLVLSLVAVAVIFTLVQARAEQPVTYHLGALGLLVLSTAPVWIDVTHHGWLQQAAIFGMALGAIGHRYRRGKGDTGTATRWDRWWALQLAAVALIVWLWMLATTLDMPSSHAQIVTGLLVLAWASVSLLASLNDSPGRGAPEAAWGTLAVVSMWLVQAGLYTSVGALHLGAAGDWILVGIVLVLLTCATLRLRGRNNGSQWSLMVVPTILALTILPYLYGRDQVLTAIGIWAMIAVWLWLICLLPAVGLIKPLRQSGLWAAMVVAMIAVPHLVDEIGAPQSWTRVSLAMTAVAILLTYRYVSAELIPAAYRNVAGALILFLTVLLWLVEAGSSQDRLAAVVLAAMTGSFLQVIERRWGSMWCAVLSGTLVILSLSTVLDLSHGPWGASAVPVAVMVPVLWAAALAIAGVDLRLRRVSPSLLNLNVVAGEWLLAPVLSALAWLLGTLISIDHVQSSEDGAWLVWGLLILPFVVTIYARSRMLAALIPAAAAIGFGSALATVTWWGSHSTLWGSEWNAGLKFALIHAVCALALALLTRVLTIPPTWTMPVTGQSIRPPLMFGRSAILGPLVGGAVGLWAHDRPTTTVIAGCLTVAAGWLTVLHLRRVGWSWGGNTPTHPHHRRQTDLLDVAMAWTLSNLSVAVFQLAVPHYDRVLWWIIAGVSFAVLGWGLRHRLAGSALERVRSLVWWSAGMVLFTLNALVVIDVPTSARQLAVIIGFTAFIALGLIFRERVSLIWGAVGVGLSILYYLRWLPYLWLGALGVALIILAIWQLRRLSRQRAEQDDDQNTPTIS